MIINKDTMEHSTLNFLNTLFRLPEIEKVAIKDVVIQSPNDYDNIKKGIDLCYHDNLSDVDFNVWVKLNPEDFYGETPVYKRYFPRLGLENEIFGVVFMERNDNENNKEVLRICLKSGFRMDLICFTRCDENTAPLPKEDLRSRIQVHRPQNFWPDWDLDKADSFWFVSIQALVKLLRKDYLISDHLSHMLLMEGLVIQMQDRDNRYQTDFHRYGYAEQIVYRNVDISNYNKYLTGPDDTYSHIAENLCRAAISYDDLAADANPLYEKRSHLFFEIWECYDLYYRTSFAKLAN